MTDNKETTFFRKVGKEIKECIMTKKVGCYIALAALALTLIQTITYCAIPKDLFNPGVIVCGVVGIVLFVALSLFRKTSSLAPIALMICDFMCLICFAGTEGLIDYVSTQFFDGFSFGKIFSLPFGMWFSVLSFVVSFILSSVAMYLPQNAEKEDDNVKTPTEFKVAEEKEI